MARGRPSKKEIILDAAQDLFALHGYQGTAIDLVVRAASVSKPTVYNNFPSKQALLQSLITRQLELSAERQQNLLSSKAQALDKLHTLFQQIIDSPFETALYRIFYGESYKLDNATLALLKAMDQCNTQNYHFALSAMTDCHATIESIIALYKEGILINALSNTKTLTSGELKSQTQVIGLINLNS